MWYKLDSVPSTSSQGQGEASLRILYWGPHLSEGAKSKGFRVRQYSHARRTEYCLTSRSGMMCVLSRFQTQMSGIILDGSSPSVTTSSSKEVSHVVISQPPTRMGLGLLEASQDSGLSSHVSLARFDPDTFLWRMLGRSRRGGWGKSLATFPKQGMTRNGVLYQPSTLVLLTKGRDGGASQVGGNVWPTPMAHDHRESYHLKTDRDGKQRCFLPNLVRDRNRAQGLPTEGTLNPRWVSWLMGWPRGWVDMDPMTMAEFQSWKDSVLNGTWWDVDPAMDGTEPRLTTKCMGRSVKLKALGNGQVPLCAMRAHEMLMEVIENE